MSSDANTNNSFIRSLFELANDYNENQRLFNNNMRRLILLMNRLNSENTMNDGFNARFTNNTSNRNNASANAQRVRNNASAQNNIANQLEDRILFYLSPFYNFANGAGVNDAGHSFPTAEQLEREVEHFIYNHRQAESAETGTHENLEEDICPISMEIFSDGMSVSRIRHCGHIFKRDCLERWFRNHNMCPVCRYNVCEGHSERNSDRSSSSVDQSSNSGSSSGLDNLHSLLQNTLFNRNGGGGGGNSTAYNSTAPSLSSDGNSIHSTNRRFNDRRSSTSSVTGSSDNGNLAAAATAAAAATFSATSNTNTNTSSTTQHPASNRNLLLQILNMLDISGATATSATATPLIGGGQVLNLFYEFEAPLTNTNDSLFDVINHIESSGNILSNDGIEYNSDHDGEDDAEEREDNLEYDN